MESHELDIEIRPNGTVSVHVKGVKGEACDAYARFFEELLHHDAERERTAEFYEPPTGVEIHIQQKNS